MSLHFGKKFVAVPRNTTSRGSSNSKEIAHFTRQRHLSKNTLQSPFQNGYGVQQREVMVGRQIDHAHVQAADDQVAAFDFRSEMKIFMKNTPN